MQAADENQWGIHMTMKVRNITTHLRADNALTLVDFLDQLRNRLMDTSGDDIKAMLQQALQQTAISPPDINHSDCLNG